MNYLKQFENKILLITGGTGSFGETVANMFLNSGIKEIRIFSRDEKKQDDMRKQYNSDKLKFYIGDVRNRKSVDTAMKGVDYVFHAAALKQVPSCEFFPMEAVNTNVLGTENVLDSAIFYNIKKVVCLSTDKAAYPINAMGISKAMMEKVAIAKSRNLTEDETVISVTRYGNVMASRGSVIPLFCKLIDSGKKLTITDPKMTRFMMTLEDAVDLVLYSFAYAKQGDLFVQKAPAATIETLAKAIMLKKNKTVGIDIIGSRHGEKLYEVLVTREELTKSEDMGKYYRISADTRDLNYSQFFVDGEQEISISEDYHSHNTQRLNEKEMLNELMRIENFNW